MVELLLSKDEIYFENISGFACFWKNLLGKGAYGSVYFGLDLSTKNSVALKIHYNQKESYFGYLAKDAKYLDLFEAVKVFPKLLKYTQKDNMKIIVESFIDPILDKLFKFCDKN